MYELTFFGYEFLTEFVPFLLVLLLLRRRQGKFSASPSKAQFVIPILFGLYVVCVLNVTDAGTLYDALTYKLAYLDGRVNLIPFSRDINPVGYALNVVMFLPFGFLVPLAWKEMDGLFRVSAAGLGFSLLIELSQILSMRGADVDDLIMNTLGAVCGFLLFQIWDKVTRSRFQVRGSHRGELPLLIGVMFLGRFLLFNRFGLIGLLFGE